MKRYTNIKQLMLNDLLIGKKVNYQQKVFNTFYNIIFPEGWEFRNFLSTSGKDTMITSAVKIIDRILYDSSWNGMQALYYNLIDMETSINNVEESSYIPQDHVIHSVHLYILGIYLYFNYSVFHNALFKYFSGFSPAKSLYYTPEENAFLQFLEAWKGFALLHDIAYPYESVFDANGKIKKLDYARFLECFKKLDLYLYYYNYIDYFAQLLLVNLIVKKSYVLLNSVLMDDIECFVGSCKTQNILKEEKFYEELKNYTKLEYVFSYEDLCMCLSWIGSKNFAIVVKDGDCNIVALIVSIEEEKYVYTSDELKNLYNLKNLRLNKLSREGYSYEVFVSGDINQLLNLSLNELNIVSRVADLDAMSSNLEKYFVKELADVIETKSLIQINYIIMKRLMKMYPIEICDEKEFQKVRSNLILMEDKEEFIQTLRKKIIEKINSKVENSSYFNQKELERILKEVECISLKHICGEVKEEYYKSKNKKNSLNVKGMEIFSTIVHKCGWFEKTKKNVSFSDNLSIYDLLDVNLEDSICIEIAKLMEKEHFIAEEEGIKKILQYQTQNVKFDHGIMASILMLNYWRKKESFAKKISCNGIAASTRRKLLLQRHDIDESIFAVMAHNIYSDIYQRKCGYLPIHDLSTNPFNYFGMFCDNLQVWDRNKSVNYGLVKWSGNTLYGEDISIEFEGEKICILCQTNDIEKSFEKLKKGLDQYLLGAGGLISLDLIENNNVNAM